MPPKTKSIPKNKRLRETPPPNDGESCAPPYSKLKDEPITETITPAISKANPEPVFDNSNYSVSRPRATTLVIKIPDVDNNDITEIHVMGQDEKPKRFHHDTVLRDDATAIKHGALVAVAGGVATMGAMYGVGSVVNAVTNTTTALAGNAIYNLVSVGLGAGLVSYGRISKAVKNFFKSKPPPIPLENADTLREKHNNDMKQWRDELNRVETEEQAKTLCRRLITAIEGQGNVIIETTDQVQKALPNVVHAMENYNAQVPSKQKDAKQKETKQKEEENEKSRDKKIRDILRKLREEKNIKETTNDDDDDDEGLPCLL